MRRPLFIVVTVVAAVAAGLTTARLLADDTANPPAAPAAPAPDVKAKEEKVRKLLKLQGSEELAKATFDRMIEAFRKLPGVTPGFLEKFREKISVQELLDLSIPPYVKHLDDATLDAAIAFYESPEGKKFAAQLPAIQAEASESSTAWAQKKAKEILKELQAQKTK